MAAVRFMFLWTHREKENLKQCKQRASYLFVLDTGSTMAETVSLPNGRSVTKMHRGLEYIQAKMAFYIQRALTSSSTGLMLFGQKKTRNILHDQGKEGYEGIREVIPQATPHPAMLERLKAVHTTDQQTDLLSALIAGVAQMTEYCQRRKRAKNVTFITDGESPTEWDQDVVDGIVEKLNADGYVLTVIGIDFDDDLIGFKESNKSKTKKQNERALRSIVDRLNTGLYGHIDRALKVATGPVKTVTTSRPSHMVLTVGDPNGDPEHIISIPVIAKKAVSAAKKDSESLLSTLGVSKKRKLPDVIDPHAVRGQKKARTDNYSRRHSLAKSLDSYGIGVGQSQAEVESIYAKFSQQASESMDNPARQLQNTQVETYDNNHSQMDLDADQDEDDRQKTYAVDKHTVHYYVFPEEQPGKNRSALTKEREAEIRAARVRAQEVGEIDPDDPERQVEEEEANQSQIVAVTTKLEKAYKYGGTLVPYGDIKDHQALALSMNHSIEVIAFAPEQVIKREWLMERSDFVCAKPGDKAAELKLSAFVTALEEKRWVALGRYVATKTATHVYLVVMFPRTTDDGTGQYLHLMQLPFAEDLKRYNFPSLTRLKTRKGRTLTEHSSIPTEKQNDAMSAFVDALNLDNAIVDDEGNYVDYYDQSSSYNPAIHNIRAAILYRQLHPDDPSVPPVDPLLAKYFTVPEEVVERAKTPTQELIKAMAVKAAPIKKTIRKGKDRPLDTNDGEIDFAGFEDDGIADDGFKPFHLEPVPSTSALTQKAEKRSHSQQMFASTSKLIDNKADLSGSETESEGEAENLHPTTKQSQSQRSLQPSSPVKVKLVSKENPIEDFKKSTFEGSQLGSIAVRSMLEVCNELVTDQNGKRWPLLMDCLKLVRRFAIDEDEVEQYNTFVTDLKDNCLNGPTVSRRRFWMEMFKPDGSLGLIADDELMLYVSKQTVSPEEARRFMDEED